MTIQPAGFPQSPTQKFTKPSPKVIKTIVDHIVSNFDPEKIILFGSYGYGKPTRSSDLDLLVMMETPQGEMETALAIRKSLPPYPFSIDVIVRSSKILEKRKALGDWFLQEISTKGKVVYERAHSGMGL